MLPVLVTPPAEMPISLAEAKAHLRVDHDGEDGLIGTYIAAATAYLDGPTGILGRALVEQTWRLDVPNLYDLRLPFADARDVSITYRDAAGQTQAVAADQYEVLAGHPDALIRFRSTFTSPTFASDANPVSVTYTAGYGAAADVPASLRAAILLHVGTLYAHRESLTDDMASPAYDALVAPYRLWR